AILLSSHILSEVERLADKVVIIRQGEIVETGTLDELRHLTRSTVTLVTQGDVANIASLEGVHDFVQTDDQSTFSVDNQHLNKELLEASKLVVTKCDSVAQTIEDLFMRHYESYVVERSLIIMKEKFARWDALFLQYLKRYWKQSILCISGLGMFAAGFVP